MRIVLWAMVTLFLVMGVGCATPTVEKTDNEAIKRDADKAFDSLKEEESRRSHEGEERY